jgi:hypothetical protein
VLRDVGGLIHFVSLEGHLRAKKCVGDFEKPQVAGLRPCRFVTDALFGPKEDEKGV